MKLTLIILAGLVGFITLFVLSGYLLPKDHIASVEKDIPAKPSEVFALVRNFREYASWRIGLRSLEPESDTIWTEIDSHGDKIRYGIEKEEAPKYLKTKILSEDLPFGGGWEFELFPIQGGTRLKITENGFVTNPLFRLLSKFVFGHTATMEAYLEAVYRTLNKSSR